MLIKTAIKNVIDGKPIIIVDDYDRENEGDIVISIDKVNIENIVFAMTKARGLMCISSKGSILDRLQIPMMCKNSTCKLGTPFTVSIDAANGITTGMSVHDRLKTIEVFRNINSKPEDLSRPGHLFPLRAKDGLLKERRGHTEASVSLMELCGLSPAAIIVEIINENGEMVRGKEMLEYAKLYNLALISVQDIYNEFYNTGV